MVPVGSVGTGVIEPGLVVIFVHHEFVVKTIFEGRSFSGFVGGFSIEAIFLERGQFKFLDVLLSDYEEVKEVDEEDLIGRGSCFCFCGESGL